MVSSAHIYPGYHMYVLFSHNTKYTISQASNRGNHSLLIKAQNFYEDSTTHTKWF